MGIMEYISTKIILCVHDWWEKYGKVYSKCLGVNSIVQ